MSAIGKLRAGIALSGLAVSLATTGTAYAQDDETDDSGAPEIVVTGTLIRGTEVVGSQTIAVDREAITQQGSTTTNEILQLVPQISNTFNGRFEVDPRGITGAGVSIQRPNLRSLPGINSASGGTTLVLVDGARVTPVGIQQSAVDVDIIPAAVLEGMDVVTDGGSSLYGADAVAGVLNFRTRRSFEGVKVDANYGFGTTLSHFDQWDAAVTAGTSWATGNAYISAGHVRRDAVLNGETDWATGEIYDADGNPSFTNTQCIEPVGSEIRYFFFGAGWTNSSQAPGAGVFPIGDACDHTAAGTYLPKLKRSNVFASLSQEVADNIDLRVTAYWVKRDLSLFGYPRGYSTPAAAPVFPANPTIGQIHSSLGGIGFSFGAHPDYEESSTRIGLETWGVTPELNIDLGGGWQVSNKLHVGRSTNFQRTPGVNQALAQDYIDGGELNPINVAAADIAVINDITDFETAQDSIHEFTLVRSVADGPLFALEGGDAKLAVGVEYQGSSAQYRAATNRTGVIGTVPYNRAERHAKSVFGELVLPLADWLDVAGSLRYDDYSDFGSTTNPNVGVKIKPFSWLQLYGHWNTSFNAPNAIDTAARPVGRFVCGIYSPGQGPQDPFGKWDETGTCAFLAEGPNEGLRPQTAESWAIGFEATPGNFRFGGQFYSIDFDNVLGAVDAGNADTYVTNPELYFYNPSEAFFAEFLSGLANGAELAEQISFDDIALLVDRRTSNIEAAKLEGVDFHVYFNTPTSFGNLSLGLNGTKQTKSVRISAGEASNQLGLGTPELTATAFAGLNAGPVSTRVTVNFSGKYTSSNPDFLGNDVTVDPFVTTNLFLGYRFEEDSGALAGTSLRLNVDNVFEETPQRIMRGTPNTITYEGWTLGRVIKLGISKEF
ncbi:TonB-dependent receptor [Novosphingobium endophyticum]|uniref:TonB-dependent receptor n=2 Tax=Novosphingobium endophyticum TaxID=1955250 RepID=A0A916TV14_9SPHN|nr:TonB-dependent receptor [Novosphingobium endophyticum]